MYLLVEQPLQIMRPTRHRKSPLFANSDEYEWNQGESYFEHSDDENTREVENQQDEIDTDEHDEELLQRFTKKLRQERQDHSPLEPEAGQPKLSLKDASYFLEILEEAHMSLLPPADANSIKSTGLRAKGKHRNAVLFEEDRKFLLESKDRISYNEEELTESNMDNPDILLLHKACHFALHSYCLSVSLAPPNSCIWSALMHRVAVLLQRSGIQSWIGEDVSGVQHKEETLFINEYHISRSNFSKLFKQILRNYAQGKVPSCMLPGRGISSLATSHFGNLNAAIPQPTVASSSSSSSSSSTSSSYFHPGGSFSQQFQ